MAQPNFRDVYADPNRFWDFITQKNDSDFEGQHFDRKEASRPDRSGTISSAKFREIGMLVEKTVSAFGNAAGGLLILGIGGDGEVIGVNHLDGGKQAGLLKLTSLSGCVAHTRIYTISSDDRETKHVALFLVEESQRSICERVSDGEAWIRIGASSQPLIGEARRRLERNRKVVDFEGIQREPFNTDDVDNAVLEEYRKAVEVVAVYEWDNPDALRHAGAISTDNDCWEWTNAGLLFFASNPQRVLDQATIRLVRFDCDYQDEDERPAPSLDKTFTGSLTKQIRDFRAFMKESGLFKTYQQRKPEGGFSEEPEYPHIAVDESIVNAVAHRDYGIRLSIMCEKYADAFVVKSPGRLLQNDAVPESFQLSDRRLEHFTRNTRLVGWLRQIKDSHGAPFVKALREGTRTMRDEMDRLNLPSPQYVVRDAETIVVLRNDEKRRAAKPTGLADEPVRSDELTNLYQLKGFLEGLAPDRGREGRRILLDVFCAKLESNGWFVDAKRMGRAVAHRRGVPITAPDAAKQVVRLYPAYAFHVREYFRRQYLVVDYTVQVQSVLTAERAVAEFGAQDVIGLKGFALYGDRAEPVRVTGLDGTDCLLRLLDRGIDERAPYTKVFPSLSRSQINRLLANVAPDYDLAREIKKASLSLETGAARTRARRIQVIADELAERVFPLSVDGSDVHFDREPLPILREGDGKRAWRVDEIKEPEVEFSHNKATANIRDGITSYGAYEATPRDVEIMPVCQRGYEDQMRALIDRLKAGKFKYRGSERTFSTRLTYPTIVTAEPGAIEKECNRLLAQHPEWRGNVALDRILLVHTPESGYALDDVTSPYYRTKRLLLESGIPCQMVDTPTLQNPDYKDLNLALNIVAKTGVTPWVLPDSIPDADFFVGLSYTKSRQPESVRVLGFANVFNRYGRWEFYSGGNSAVSYEEREAHYEALVTQTLSKLSLPDRPTICFHYSARYSRADRAAILRGARSVCPNGKYVFVWINTDHPVRMFDERAETDGSVARGRYAIGADNQFYLSTTGYNPYRKTLGTPHALEINVYVEHPKDEYIGPLDHRAMARQILSLTKLNWASSDSLCAQPITTKYAKDIAYLTAAFQRQEEGDFRLHPILERTPWFI